MAFGSNINAGLLNPDYSAIERAGQSRGQGMQAMGQGIGNALEAFGDYKKEQGKKKKTIKQSELYIEAAMKIFPELQGSLEQARMTIQDENNPLDDRFAAAESVQGLLNMGIEGMKAKSERMDSLLAHEAKMDEARRKPRHSMEINDGKGNKVRVFLSPDTGEYHDAQGNQRTNYGEGGGGGDTTLGDLPGGGVPELSPDALAAIQAVMGPPPGSDIPTDGQAVENGLAVLPDNLPNNLPFGTAPAAGNEQWSEDFNITAADGRPLLAQRNLNTGKIQILNTPPAGMFWEITTDRDGNTTVRQTAGQQKDDDIEQAQKDLAAVTAMPLFGDVARIISDYERQPQGDTLASRTMRFAASNVPGLQTEMKAIQSRIATVKATVSFGYLTKLRAASKTGGALGQVSDLENRKLEAVMGSLDASLPPQEVKAKLRQIVRMQAEAMYGKDTEIDKAVKEGKVTAAEGAKLKEDREEAYLNAASGNVSFFETLDPSAPPPERAPTERAPTSPSLPNQRDQELFDKYNTQPQFNPE